MKRLISSVLPIAALVWLTWTSTSHAAPHEKRPDLQGRVVSVTDGDTVVLQISSKRERVRLIGIDTPESKYNPRSRKQADQNHLVVDQVVRLGKLAAAHTQKLLPVGTPVRVEFDLEQRDRYGRLLAYLWLPNGTMVNEEIISSGFAYPLTVPPNVKYQDRFLTGFRDSRRKQLGLWSRR
jgi:micrococcal nuclease